MDKIVIKLEYLGDGFKELTTFHWENNSLKLVSLEGEDFETGKYSDSDKNGELYIDDRDLLMIENYIKLCDKNLIEYALMSGAEICFKKEIWMDMQPAIVESWLEKDSCIMLRKSTKVDYCNTILPIIMDYNNFYA